MSKILGKEEKAMKEILAKIRKVGSVKSLIPAAAHSNSAVCQGPCRCRCNPH